MPVHERTQMVTVSKDVRNIYEELYAQVSLLTFKWLTYKELFSVDQQRLGLLDRTARSFFQVYHNTLLSDVLLSFSRLTDKPNSHKGARISLRRPLLQLDSNVDSTFAATFTALVKQAEQECVPFRQLRNKVLAHLSMDVILNSHLHPLPDLTIKQLDDALKNIQTSLTAYSENVFDESHLFVPIQAVGDATSLIGYIERGLKCLDERHASQLRE
jgi:hypothetical protein